MSKTTKRAVNAPNQLTDEEQKRDALLLIFEQITNQAGAFIQAFDTDKYRLLVTINHQELDSDSNLIKELICYHFNVTISLNKHGFHYLYFNHDAEASSHRGFIIRCYA